MIVNVKKDQFPYTTAPDLPIKFLDNNPRYQHFKDFGTSQINFSGSLAMLPDILHLFCGISEQSQL